VPEDGGLRQLLYGRRPHVYRIIYEIDEGNRIVSVLHIRHGARDVMTGED
jgi:mRNA-degrading endonuclease RelE of RelBE toxin-antitoxin system